jgi:hypothetical protein
MTIRTGTISEIEKFQLYDEANDGEQVTVVEIDGQIAAYAQHTDGDIYFLESEAKGAGRMLVEWFQGEYGYLVAKSVEPTAAGFWSKMGFQPAGKDGFGGENWDYE